MKRWLIAILITFVAVGANSQSNTGRAQDMVAANNDWIACSLFKAKEYARQEGTIGDLADAALGACQTQFNKKVTVEEAHYVSMLKASGNPSQQDILAIERDVDSQTKGERSQMRATLMSMIVEIRMRRLRKK